MSNNSRGRLTGDRDYGRFDGRAINRLLYELVTDPTGLEGIKCRLCGLTSWNPNDVRERYCGACHIFLAQYAEDFGDEFPGLR